MSFWIIWLYLYDDGNVNRKLYAGFKVAYLRSNPVVSSLIAVLERSGEPVSFFAKKSLNNDSKADVTDWNREMFM